MCWNGITLRHKPKDPSYPKNTKTKVVRKNLSLNETIKT